MVSMSSQTNLVPQPSPQKAIRVSVEIPTCDGFGDGHEVTIQVSPKKPSRGSNPADNAPSYSEIQPIVFDTTSSTVDPPAFESAAAATIPPSTTANVSPNTLAITTAIVYDSEEEDVFGMVKGPNSSEVGRKEKRWYLITRGRKVGVFYKFWADIQHYVKENGKVINGAAFKTVGSKNDGIAKFAAAEAKGAVAVI